MRSRGVKLGSNTYASLEVMIFAASISARSFYSPEHVRQAPKYFMAAKTVADDPIGSTSIPVGSIYAHEWASWQIIRLPEAHVHSRNEILATVMLIS